MPMVSGTLKNENGQAAPAGTQMALGTGTGASFVVRFTASTGTGGTFVFPNVVAGKYNIRIGGNCFGCTPSSVTVGAVPIPNLNIVAPCL